MKNVFILHENVGSGWELKKKIGMASLVICRKIWYFLEIIIDISTAMKTLRSTQIHAYFLLLPQNTQSSQWLPTCGFTPMGALSMI